MVPILAALVISGCSSFWTHSGLKGEFGHPYVGTQMALINHPCHLVTSSKALFIPYPFFLADLALSTVVDTILLPIDMALIFSSDKKRSEIIKIDRCGEYN